MLNQKAIHEEIKQRLIVKLNIPDILKDEKFTQQIGFIKHPAKQKTLFCTRRSAKSYTAGLYLVTEALNNPGCNCLFVGLTRASAKAIIWKDILTVLDTKYGLKATFNQADLTMTFPNGSVIYVTGADADEKEMYKLLGRKFRLACIDEASMYTIDLRNLVYGILGPAMVDPNDDDESGTICLLGTASDFPRGLFYDITVGTEMGWELFSWTAHDNIYVAKKWQEALDKIAAERPAYMETPQFKQWYLNQWVIDEEKRVYKFDIERNLCKISPNLKTNGWTFILGSDLGFDDDNAFIHTAYHENDPNLYVIDCFSRNKMYFNSDELPCKEHKINMCPDCFVVQRINTFMNGDYPPCKVIIDGANKQGVESMRLRSSIPFEYADKRDKATFIELCNSDLVQGKIKFINTPNVRKLWEEMAALVWKTEGDKIKFPKKEHPKLPNHKCDAFLYGWRNGYHYSTQTEKKKFVIGSREWYLKQSEDIWEHERERLSQPQSEWPEEGSLGELG